MSDSKPARPSAAANVSGHRPPRQQSPAVKPRPQSEGASRHHDGAATGKLGRTYRQPLTKVLNRFPIQNRRDQTRQQSPAAARRHHDGAATGKLGTTYRQPPPRNRVASRLDFVATKCGSNWSAGLSPAYRSSFCIFCRNRRDRDRCVLPLQQFSRAFWAVPRFRRGIRSSASLPACAPSASREP